MADLLQLLQGFIANRILDEVALHSEDTFGWWDLADWGEA